jgi:hypothetical protein
MASERNQYSHYGNACNLLNFNYIEKGVTPNWVCISVVYRVLYTKPAADNIHTVQCKLRVKYATEINLARQILL